MAHSVKIGATDAEGGPALDAERITAELKDGVLTVVCPKHTGSSTRRVDIS